ncbi:uncharacterized protein LOC128735826 [Sabethes cyaneus]|uniref:uncharacterized protein LOC128735826 n=1 Tax=Sabethes cyaneus TaxID=53552 RepID=UPI00237EB3CB|nr:uncharacterized protein LOC128735826 [Sabethes cyaneus]
MQNLNQSVLEYRDFLVSTQQVDMKLMIRELPEKDYSADKKFVELLTSQQLETFQTLQPAELDNLKFIQSSHLAKTAIKNFAKAQQQNKELEYDCSRFHARMRQCELDIFMEAQIAEELQICLLDIGYNLNIINTKIDKINKY